MSARARRLGVLAAQDAGHAEGALGVCRSHHQREQTGGGCGAEYMSSVALSINVHERPALLKVYRRIYFLASALQAGLDRSYHIVSVTLRFPTALADEAPTRASRKPETACGLVSWASLRRVPGRE